MARRLLCCGLSDAAWGALDAERAAETLGGAARLSSLHVPLACEQKGRAQRGADVASQAAWPAAAAPLRWYSRLLLEEERCMEEDIPRWASTPAWALLPAAEGARDRCCCAPAAWAGAACSSSHVE